MSDNIEHGAKRAALVVMACMILALVLIAAAPMFAFQVPTQPVSGIGTFTITPGTGTYSSTQSGAWSVSPGTGTYPVTQANEWRVISSTITRILKTATSDAEPLTTRFSVDNLGGFGDLIVAEKTPVIQLDFVYGLNSQTSTFTVVNAATVDTSTGMLRMQTGTNAAGAATFFSVLPARYRAGQGIIARFTTRFTTGVSGSTQTIGVGDNGDGYFFGYNGTSFGILHKNRSLETWIPQASWNADTADGNGPSGLNWDKTKGNVLQITYPYLGFGNIKFFIQDKITSRFVLLHTIQYTNTNDTPQVSNPSLKFKAYVANSGNTTNVVAYVGSVGVFLNGKRIFLGPQFGVSNVKTGVSTEQSIFVLRNATTYNGVPNTGVLRLRSLSFANDNGTAIGTMRIIRGAAVGGSPEFIPIRGTTANNGVTITSGESIASYDVVGTTGTAGYTIFNTLSSRNTNIEVDLTPYEIYVSPGEDLIFSAQCASASSFGISVNWNEDN